MTQFSPLTVVGESFRPYERVVIKVSAGTETLVRRVRAARRGSFAIRFQSVTVDRCGGGVTVFATTANGLVAKVRMPQLLCPPAIP